MYLFARFVGTIIIGRLHNFKTSVNGRIGHSGPFVIPKLPVFSREGEGRESCPEIVVNARRGTRSSQKLFRNPWITLIARPKFKLVSLLPQRITRPLPHARYNIPQKSQPETSCRGYGYTMLTHSYASMYRHAVCRYQSGIPYACKCV